ncbi:MAG: TonB-dependent receptor plug domain-containing protein [Limisphaerales bacterium]
MNKLRFFRRRILAGAFPCPGGGCAAILMLVLSFAPGAAPAQTNSSPKSVDLTELPLEALMNLEVPTVYAASKIEQKTTQAPASVTVVTSDEIKMFGYRTLADVLQSVPGFNVSYDRDYDFLGAMGISLGDANNRILLLVNGHRVNNNYTDSAAIGTDFILDVDLVDRVEVIRGPSAVLYGNNAFLGVINVITRQGKQMDGVEASFDYGSFDTYHGRVSFGKQFTNGVELLLSGSIYESAGAERLYYKQFNTPAQNYGVATNMDGGSFRSFFASLGFKDLTLEGAFNDRDKVNPTALFDTTFNNPSLRTVDEQGYTTLKFAHSFPDVVDVTAKVSFDGYSHDIGYPFGTSLYTEDYKGEWWDSEVQLNKTLWDRLLLTLGGEYRDDFLQQDQTSGQIPVEAERVSYGAYLQGDFAVVTNLHLSAGERFDQYDDFASAFDPRLALIYNPVKTSTIKAIYGTAFRAPDFYEQYLSGAQIQNLSPEEISSYELDYDQQIGPHLRSSLSGFYNDMRHLIVYDNGSYTNLNAQTKGVELAFDGSWAGGIRGRASYSYEFTQNDTVPWQLPDSPNHMFKFNLSVPLIKDKLFVGAEYQFTSERLSLQTVTDAKGDLITAQGETAGGYGVVNLTLFSQKLIKNLEFSASVYNLLNTQYWDPASDFHGPLDIIEQDGRTFRVKVTYRF